MTGAARDEHAVASSLLESYGKLAARRGRPVWLQVRLDPGGEPEARPVDNPEGLLGHVVGPDWDGAAVIGTGRVRVLDEAHEPPAALVPGLAGGLVLACLVTRRGAVGWRMRLPDGSFFDQVPEEGFMLDILRRSLELPTPPPADSLKPFEVAAWLAAVVEGAIACDRRLSWPEVLARHPAGLGRPEFEALVLTDPVAAEEAIRGYEPQPGWEEMRMLVASGVETEIAPPAALAAWMDEGMFARWMLRELPGLDGQLRAARPHLQSAAYRRLRHLVRSLDTRAGVR